MKRWRGQVMQKVLLAMLVVAGLAGAGGYYLANGAPTFPALLRWVKVGDFNALARDAELQFLGNRE